MRSVKYISAIVVLCALSISVFSEQKTKYLTQEAVDTSIVKGFYVLTEAASVAGVGFKQKEAIETAKRLAKNLREKAKGDPNERYILWKVGELEAQIYLEEKDLLLHKMQQGQISINSWVSKYNAEVGKSRPDFAILKKIHVEMNELDVNKANELADSYNKRYKAISREVIFSIEKAVMSGDVAKAREELGYCLRNKTYLTISNSKYEQLEKRVEGLITAYEQKPFIVIETESALKFVNALNLKNARDSLNSARYRLKSASQFFPQSETSNLQIKIDKAEKLLVRKEDSLVNVNLGILSKQGIKPADAYLQTVLKPAGVSLEKAAYVDSVILMISTPEKSKMVDEVESVAAAGEDSSDALNDIMSAAKKKAQIKLDSIRIEDEKKLKKMQAERAYKDSIEMARYEAEQKKLKMNQDKASDITNSIYTYLEQNRLKDADKLFQKEKTYLRQYLPGDAYGILDITLKQFLEPVEPQSVAYIAPVDQNPKAAKVSSPASADATVDKNRVRAQDEIMAIYAMLEKNDITSAYNKFQSIKKPLQKFLDKEVYEVLETTVLQTYEYAKNSK